MRSLLAFLFVSLAASVASAQDTAQPPSSDVVLPEEELLETADSIAERVGQIRGLPVKREVKKGIKKREELRAVLMEKLAQEVPDSAIEAESDVFKRLGIDGLRYFVGVAACRDHAFHPVKARRAPVPSANTTHRAPPRNYRHFGPFGRNSFWGSSVKVEARTGRR